MNAVTTFRDALFGNPPQPNLQPSREGLLAGFTELAQQVAAYRGDIKSIAAQAGLGALVDVIKETKSSLDADLAHAANTVGMVYGDASDANNDLYVKVGGPGTGSWTNTGAMHSIMEGLAGGYVEEAEAARDATIAAMDTLVGEAIEPFTIDGSGTAFTSTTVFYWPDTKADVGRWLTGVDVDVAIPGTFVVVVAEDNGDATLDFYSAETLTLSPTETAATGLEIFVPAGHVVGVACGTGQMNFETGTIPDGLSQWRTTDIPATATAYTTTTSDGAKWNATLTAEIPFKAEAGFAKASAVGAIVGETANIGWPGPIVGTGDDAPANYSIVIQQPLPTGRLTELKIGAAGSASLTISLVTMAGDDVTIISQEAKTVAAGVNTIPLDIDVEDGQFVAVTCTGMQFQASNNPTGRSVWSKTGALVDGETLSNNASHRFEVSFTVLSGLVSEIDRAQSGGADYSVLSALEGADATGATDSTAAFAAGKAEHAAPYLRPGTFDVTATPANGGGIWGPGAIIENDRRRLITLAPSAYSLWEKFRAEMMEHIANGDVLTLISDSIGEYIAPGTDGTRHDHWFNILTGFANMGVALDEPGEAALRPDSASYDPSWNGITTSGSVSSGTKGPLGAMSDGGSLILASGAAISFTGAYAHIAVHYQQGAGAGSLSFQYNGGSAFGTVNAAGSTENDKFSGLKASGQMTSGTFTITASGGSVEITNLVRLGVKAAGPHGRLLTQRIARGGWALANYVPSANTDAILKIGTMGGGKCVPIIALGTNDLFYVSPATLIGYATTVIDALEAGDVPRIYGAIPMRPSAAWDSVFEPGLSYEAAAGALRRLYRERGVTVLPWDGVDWNGEGWFGDGLHTNVAGQPRMAQITVERMAGV